MSLVFRANLTAAQAQAGLEIDLGALNSGFSVNLAEFDLVSLQFVDAVGAVRGTGEISILRSLTGNREDGVDRSPVVTPLTAAGFVGPLDISGEKTLHVMVTDVTGASGRTRCWVHGTRTRA